MSTASAASEAGPVEIAIRTKLTELLNPSELVIENDSWKHKHHAPMRAYDGDKSETHFSVQVISAAFAGKTMIQRHRLINSALKDEFTAGLHALSLKTKTPDELAASQST